MYVTLSPPFAITLFTKGTVGLCGGKKTTTSPTSGPFENNFFLHEKGTSRP